MGDNPNDFQALLLVDEAAVASSLWSSIARALLLEFQRTRELLATPAAVVVLVAGIALCSSANERDMI